MINLLPEEMKKDIKAARMNVVLLRYNIITAIAIGLLGVFCAFFYLMMGMSQSSAVTKTSDNSAKAASYAQVRQEADTYRANLTIAKSILSNSVNYTSVVFAITNQLPKNVVLDNLTLRAADFGQQITFAAKAKSYADATALKESFQNSKIFSNVYLENLIDAGSTGQSSTYPISVTISVKLNKVAS